MDFQATFSNQSGQAKTLDIKDGFNLQDAYNVVANDDFAPTQITLEPINMNSSYSNVEPDKQVETAYDLIGRHSSNDIIDKHKISSDELATLLEEGTNHELEHTSSYLIAMKIAQDHLYEDLMYYSKIKQAMLSRGAALNMSKVTPKYAEGTKLSYPIYVRLKANVDKFAVMNFLNQYPKVEDVMNRYVRTPNVKAGYLTFMADKDANDQNLEQWGAKVKGYYESPDGTKIKRYEWNFGEAEGFAEVFQYLYDKHNGYAKGGMMGKDYSEKMMSSAYAMPFQDWFNKNIMDVTESYNDAKRDYEDGQNKPFGIKLGKYAKSLHNEFAKNNNFKDGGLIAPNGKASNLTPEQYKMVRTPEFKTWFGDWENDPENASKVVDENGEPLVVYRGDTSSSKKGFVFKKGFNQIGYINKDRLPNQYFHYFVNNYDVALGYADSVVDNHNEKVKYAGKGKLWQPKVTQYFLNIRNPIDITPNNRLFPTYNEYVNIIKTLFPEEMIEREKYKYPFFYGSEITNSDLDKIFQDKLGENYLEDKYISDYTKRQFIQDKGLHDSYLFFIQFNDRYYQGDLLHKMYLSMLDNNVDGLLFLEMTHWEGEFYKNFKKYESGKLKYDYKRWTEMPKIYATFESNQIKLADGTNTTFDGKNPDIRFDKGGYVSEEVLIENNIGKIDDIYVLSENDKPVKSLGEFTLRGFGKFVMKDLAGELYDDYKIRLRSDFAFMLGNDIIKPSIKVAQMKGNEIELLAIIYNALVTDEQPVSYVFNEDGEVVGKFTDEDFAEDMVNDNDGYYSEIRVEEVSTPETILAMQFDFNKQEMTFVSTLLEKQSTHKFKYGGKL